MAVTLKSTGFQSAVSYKIISCTGFDGATSIASQAQKNVTNAPGRLFSVTIESLQSTSDVYLKLFDGASPTAGVSIPQWVLKGKTKVARTYTIPYGIAFSELSFWVSGAPGQTDTSSFNGTVDITLVCS
jgi:hypothetical protein